MDPVIIKQKLHAPIAQVWKALTDIQAMKFWYFDVSGFEPTVGFRFEFSGQGKKGEHYTHLCEITKADAPHLLEYTWSYEGLPGSSLVSFKLEEAGEETMITVTHSGIGELEKNGDDFRRENFEQGWTALIGTNLPAYLANKS